MCRLRWGVLIVVSLALLVGCGKGRTGTLNTGTPKPYELADTRIQVTSVGNEKMTGVETAVAMAVGSAIIDYSIEKLKEKSEELTITRTVSSDSVGEGYYRVSVANGMFSSQNIEDVPYSEGDRLFNRLKKTNVLCEFLLKMENRTVIIKPEKVEYADSMTGGWGGKRNLSIKISVVVHDPQEAVQAGDKKTTPPTAVVVMPFEDIEEGMVIGNEWFADKKYTVVLPGAYSEQTKYVVTVELTEIKGKSAVLMNVAGVAESVKKSTLESESGE